MKSKNPLTDDNAHCIIKGKAQYLSVLRRNQGSHVQTPKWIKCTPEQMVRYMEDDRNGHLYGRHVVAAIKPVWSTAVCEGEYDMREEMSSFGAKLSFREMCVVLKEQKSWRQVRDFYYWMKLQLDRFIPNRSAMDFSSNVLSIALGSTVYLWDAADGSTSELVTLDEESGPVTSVKWPPDGRHIAIGLNNSEVQLWDSTANRLLRTLRGGHSSRVGALDWKNHILTTGGMDGQIINNDVSEGTRRRNLMRPSPRSLWALNY